MYFRRKVKEHQLNFDPECIKDFNDAVIKNHKIKILLKNMECLDLLMML